MKETKSKWEPVTRIMDGINPIELGRYASYWYHKTPRRILHCLSYYKFAAKMIGHDKKVLDVGCNEGLGTYLIAKECGYAMGVDFDEEAIATAKKNYTGPFINFTCEDIIAKKPTDLWDAAVSFDVIEHITEEHTDGFMTAISSHLKEEGAVVIGTPSEISQTFASEISRRGNINVYSPQRFEALMQNYFDEVFLFAANDEVVHTGYLPLAHYLIALCCKKK
jgi:2-polyprenyl-3-methyl-5-hydroxy-6-metoxy-1,4-benzoquinol methylase